MNESEELEIGSRDCTRFSELVELKWTEDRPWSATETEFYAAHKQSCAACREFHDLVHACEDAAETALTPADGTVSLAVRRAVDQKFGAKKRFQWKPAAAAVALAAGIAAAVISFSGTPTETDESAAVFALSEGGLVVNGRTVGVGERFSLESEAPKISTDALIEIPDTLYVAMEKNARIGGIARNPETGTIRIALQTGRIAVHLVPGSALKLEVETSGGLVTVTGTVFIVEAEAQKETVSVLRGSVRVNAGPATRSVKAGRAFSFSENREMPRPVYSDDRLLHLLGVPESLSAERSEEISEEREPSPLETVDSDSDKLRENTAPRPAPELLLQAARACRADKKWKCAVDNYGKLVILYPGLPDAATAMIPMAQILLDNLNRPQEALQYFRRYRKRRPQGGLSQEALYGECRALSRLGRQDAEQKCLEQYLEKYPNTLYTQMAKQRLIGIMDKE